MMYSMGTKKTDKLAQGYIWQAKQEIIKQKSESDFYLFISTPISSFNCVGPKIHDINSWNLKKGYI